LHLRFRHVFEYLVLTEYTTIGLNETVSLDYFWNVMKIRGKLRL